MPATETVTALITDLVGSTALESRLGPEAAADLRREHFRLLRASVEACGGTEVKNTGDGVVAVFRGAVGALSCAVSIQQAVERRNRSGQEPLAIRVGVALGDVSSEDGDYFGSPMVEATRLCARADGGQILLTDLVRRVGGRDGDAFQDVGELELKGLPQPVATWDLHWEPVASHGAPPLPAALQATSSIESVGRGAEQDLVQACWSVAFGGEPRALLVAGDPGMGKTRLLVDAAAAVHGDGALVVFGHCEEGLGAAYGAWMEALSHLVELAPADALVAHVERHGGELSRLVPSLRRHVDAPRPVSTDPETERYLLFSAVTGALEELSADPPIVLLLDDLHWADRPTLSLLKHVLANVRAARLLVVATYAESDLPRDHSLRQVLADLRRQERVERLTLRGLSEDAVVSLMELAAGQQLNAPGRALARELAAETGGNPFFIRELLQHLAESGALARAADGEWHLVPGHEELGLPQSVREVVGRRVERLGAECSAVLGSAAVVGREFDLDVLRRVVTLDEDQLIEVLDAAVGASLVRESPAQPGSYLFAHNLINHTLYETLTSTRRARIHRRVAQALEASGTDDSGRRVTELARHWSAAASTDLGRAARYSVEAGRRALAALAPEQALPWFERALALLEKTPDADATERCEALIGRGEAERQAGRPEFRETLLVAGRLADDLDDSDRMARAALGNSRGFVSSFGTVDRERVDALKRALEATTDTDPARRARLLTLQAMELQFDFDHGHRRAIAEEGLALAREAGDARILPYVLRDYFHAVWSTDTFAVRRQVAEEMAELGARVDDPLASIWALDRQINVFAEAGELVDAAAASARLCERTNRLGQPGFRWHAAYYAAGLAQLRGELGEADRLAEAARELGASAGEPDAIVVYLGQLCAVRIEQGRAGDILGLLEQAAAENAEIPAFESGLAVALCEVGRSAEAAAILERATARGFADVPRDHIWSAALTAWARAAADIGSRPAAARLYDLLEPWHDLVVWSGAVGYGSIASYLGMLAATVGSHDRARDHFAAASRLHRRAGISAWEARNLCYRAGSELASGALEDGRSSAQQALALAREGGYPASARHAERLLQAADGQRRLAATWP